MDISRLPEEMVAFIAEIASEYAIEKHKEEVRREKANREKERIKKVKDQLKAYRIVKKDLEEYKEYTEEEKAEQRFNHLKDLMESPYTEMTRSESITRDEAKKRERSLYTIYRIETALRLYKEDCDLAGKEEDKRRYRIVHDLYIADTPLTTSDIAKKENVSEKTVYRDLGVAYQILAIYLYGI